MRFVYIVIILFNAAFWAEYVRDDDAALPGIVVGALICGVIHLHRKLSALAKTVDDLARRVESSDGRKARGAAPKSGEKTAPAPPQTAEEPTTPSAVADTEIDISPAARERILSDGPPLETADGAFPLETVPGEPSSFTLPSQADDAPATVTSSSGTEWREAARKASVPRPSPAWNPVEAIKAFFTTGNVVVKVGVVILFFGVGFLLNYAAALGFITIELRLAGVAGGGGAMLVVGWRVRERRRGYALVVQGGAIGILYGTIFAAAQIYGLIPLPFAFVLMVALAVLSGLLAVWQDSLPLAAFGSAGGFMAPILAASGEGSHIVLFSYYAVLNAGILQIAWSKAWRVLNLIGFTFTFVIGGLWGLTTYRSENFATTEPFLILFFLFYVAISILFALRQPPRLRGFVDGSLVFGLPIIAFTLQAGMVERFEYGLAISALALSLFYVGLATALWNRNVAGMRMLTEAFLALGVVFGTLAIPLALDGRWTSAAWALEGAALVWIGVRQNRLAARLFGTALLFGAGIAFADGGPRSAGTLPVLNGIFLSGMVISLSALFSAWYLERNGDRLWRWERFIRPPILILIRFWGILWWFGAGLNEIDTYIRPPNDGSGALLFVALSFAGAAWLSVRLAWRAMRYPPLLLMPWMGFVLFIIIFHETDYHFLRFWAGIAWIATFGCHLYILRALETDRPGWTLRAWHVAGLILATFTASHELTWQAGRFADGGAWATVAWAVAPCVAAVCLSRWYGRMPWPVRAFPAEYGIIGPEILALFLFLWQINAASLPGDPEPLRYFPLINPMDLAQCTVFIVLIRLARRLEGKGRFIFLRKNRTTVYGVIAAAVFLWLNAVVGRTVHVFGDVPYTARRLSESGDFQTAISILWTTVAFGIMAVASRRALRKVWYVGCGLLGVVVLKLFAVDLEGAITRIVSFMAVGVLMLVIGYVAPPPAKEEEIQ